MRGVAVVAAAALAASVAGCGNESERVQIDPGVDTPSASSTSSSPTKDPDLAAAEAKVTQFKSLLAEIATNPKKSIDDVSLVARGKASARAKHSLATMRADGVQAEGWYEYRGITSKKSAKDGEVLVDMCIDLTMYKVIANGKERKGADAVHGKYTVEKAGDKWYVIEEDTQQQDC